jgi:hypothetical protein
MKKSTIILLVLGVFVAWRLFLRRSRSSSGDVSTVQTSDEIEMERRRRELLAVIDAVQQSDYGAATDYVTAPTVERSVPAPPMGQVQPATVAEGNSRVEVTGLTYATAEQVKLGNERRSGIVASSEPLPVVWSNPTIKSRSAPVRVDSRRQL